MRKKQTNDLNERKLTKQQKKKKNRDEKKEIVLQIYIQFCFFFLII